MATANRNRHGVRTMAGAWVRGVAAVTCAALAGVPLPALSQVAGLEDLTYQGDDYAAREMPKRGYVLTHSESRQGKSWQYWWKASDSRCTRLSIEAGRVVGAKHVDEHDCNQRSSSSPGSSDMSDGAKVAIAAAAILGVAMLAHKSHENHKDRDKQSPQDVAEFDRGYRDGLYHQGYHNYNNRPDYTDGYNKGSEKRAAETAYRSKQGGHSGYASYVNLQDLNGARGSSAESAMLARGFVGRGGYKDGGRSINMWWNASTRQCVNVAVQDGRVAHISPIPEGNCR